MLHYFRSASFAKGLSFVALTSFMMTSCNKANVQPTGEIPSPIAAEVAAGYSGEQLFKGIFLLEGEVTTKIPYLHGFRSTLDKQKLSDPDKALKRHEQAQALAAKVQQLDPSYFGELKAAITSQNFDQVHKAIQHGASLMKAASVALLTTQAEKDQFAKGQQIVKGMDLSKYNFQNQEDVERFIADAKTTIPAGSTDLKKQDLDVVLVTDIAVFLYFVVSVAVVALLVVPAAQGPGDDSATKLEKEQFIQQLAMNLN